MAIRQPTLRLGRLLRVAVGKEADEATRALAASWVKAWSLLSADMEAAVLDVLALAKTLDRWPYSYELNRVDRLYRVMRKAQVTIVELGKQAGVTITDAAGNAIDITAKSEPQIMASQLPPANQAAAATRYADLVRPSALDLIVRRTTERITSATRPLSADAIESMHRALIRGVAMGYSPRKAASQMVAGLQDGFNGGLARAVNIARTEILDAYRQTSQYAHAANSDVLDGWIWLCTLTARTCPSCIAMNGTVHPLDEPGPLDHQSGRCARMPKVKSWADLGIPLAEPASTVPDARQWFAGQPVETQQHILGPGRLALLNSGQITWDDIPQLRPSTDWRPSYAPASLAALQRTAAAR